MEVCGVLVLFDPSMLSKRKASKNSDQLSDGPKKRRGRPPRQEKCEKKSCEKIVKKEGIKKKTSPKKSPKKVVKKMEKSKPLVTPVEFKRIE